MGKPILEPASAEKEQARQEARRPKIILGPKIDRPELPPLPCRLLQVPREIVVKKLIKELLKAAVAAGTGAAAGAGVNVAIGGIGVAAAGGAIGVTLAPMAVVGAGVAAAGYGLYWLGKEVGRSQGGGGGGGSGGPPGETAPKNPPDLAPNVGPSATEKSIIPAYHSGGSPPEPEASAA